MESEKKTHASPRCGGTVACVDGWYLCTTPGFCSWCQEVDDGSN